MHGINCQGCEFLRHEPPEGSVPGLRHMFRCMNPANGIFCGHILDTVKPQFYYDGMPIFPLFVCAKEERA